jgi:hypothetical protein
MSKAQQTATANSSKQIKRKRKAKSAPVVAITTSSSSDWAYIHITMLMSGSRIDVDELTVRSCLLQALSTYLGDHGAAIAIDILSISEDVSSVGTRRPSAYIRVANEDAEAVVAGISSFSGSSSVQAMSVRRSSVWLAPLVAGSDGQELFQMTAQAT